MSKSPIRVLLVDDHLFVRYGVRAFLRTQGLAVVGEASDVKGALRMAKALGPDVIVLDVKLPDLEGGKLARRLRRLVPGVKLVAFSMHSGPEYETRMERCGARAFVSKEGPTAELVTAIRQVHAGRKYFPAGSAR